MHAMIGQQFNFLTVLAKSSYKSGYYTCRCICGMVKDVSGHALRTGKTKSCGCFRKQPHVIAEYLPGNKFTFQIWTNMKRQGYDPTYRSYRLHGKPRVPVCDAWMNYYEFVSWLEVQGPLDRRDYELVLLDSKLGYCPDNCRWTPRKPKKELLPQVSKYVGTPGAPGIHLNISKLCHACKMPRSTVYRRLKQGWSLIKAISVSPSEYRKSKIPIPSYVVDNPVYPPEVRDYIFSNPQILRDVYDKP